MEKEPLTTAEVAGLFRVTGQTIRNWVAAKKLKPAFRAGRTPTSGFLFDRNYIEQMLELGETKAERP